MPDYALIGKVRVSIRLRTPERWEALLARLNRIATSLRQRPTTRTERADVRSTSLPRHSTIGILWRRGWDSNPTPKVGKPGGKFHQPQSTRQGQRAPLKSQYNQVCPGSAHFARLRPISPESISGANGCESCSRCFVPVFRSLTCARAIES